MDGPEVGTVKGRELHSDLTCGQQGGGGVLVCTGIIKDELVGPFWVEDGVKLNSQTYCQFLEDNFFKQWYRKKSHSAQSVCNPAPSVSSTLPHLFPILPQLCPALCPIPVQHSAPSLSSSLPHLCPALCPISVQHSAPSLSSTLPHLCPALCPISVQHSAPSLSSTLPHLCPALCPISKIENIRDSFSRQPPEPFLPTSQPSTSKTNFSTITEDRLSTLLSRSDLTTCSLDPIPSHFIPNLATVFIPTLTHLFNLSLTT
ncbi:unnamed protein product, partial [Ranitomeya imitator]